MANITRFTPFDDVFDDVLRGFFVRPVAVEAPVAGTSPFRVDVTEDNGTYTVRADIPGVKKDDIHITIDGDQVAISTEVKREKDVKEGERVLRSERYYGKVSRAFSLGQEVDEAAASAKYADGVLELTLPKKAAPKAKRIAIQ
jgi:HSP20 family protein